MPYVYSNNIIHTTTMGRATTERFYITARETSSADPVPVRVGEVGEPVAAVVVDASPSSPAAEPCGGPPSSADDDRDGVSVAQCVRAIRTRSSGVVSVCISYYSRAPRSACTRIRPSAY